MTLQPIIGSALKVPLFHGLEPEQMSELVQRAERVVYEPGEALIQNGELGDAAILVVTGRATQFNAFSSTHPYDPIGPGSLVGEMAMLVETTHYLSVVADEPVKALKFHRAMIEAFMGEDPRLADHFVSRIASRLNDLAAEMRATIAAPTSTAAKHDVDVDDVAGTAKPVVMASEEEEHAPSSSTTQTFQGTQTSPAETTAARVN